jgi:hypothetical protein
MSSVYSQKLTVPPLPEKHHTSRVRTSSRLDNRPSWDDTTVTFSFTNPEMHPMFRTYFDRPRPIPDMTGSVYDKCHWVPSWSIRAMDRAAAVNSKRRAVSHTP